VPYNYAGWWQRRVVGAGRLGLYRRGYSKRSHFVPTTAR
jgi:hypothetical protein